MSRMINVIIVDDELPARKELASILQNIKNVNIVAECALGQEALAFLEDNFADIIFLDIEMPVINGIEVAKLIQTTSKHKPAIVFSTGFDQFAVKAFELNAFDYILKPYTTERILATIMRFGRNIGKKNGTAAQDQLKITIWNGDKLLVLNAETEISLIQASQQQALIYSSKGVFSIASPLKDLEAKLNNRGFLRTHKSYLININKVREIIPWFNDTYVLTLDGCTKKDIPVSRHFMAEFKKLLNI